MKTHDTNSNKYIQYKCGEGNACGGLADRLKGLLSVYAISLITNRTFLIDMPWPCPVEDMYDANQVNWLRGSAKLDSRTKETVREINYSWEHYQLMSTENIVEFVANSSSLLSILTGTMFMNAFANNPFLKDRIKELGYKELPKFKLQYVFHDWYNKLFKLKKETAAKYELMRQKVKKHIPGSKLICAQVRLGGVTLGNKIDNVISKSNQTSQMFWKFMSNTFLSKLNDSNYMIYVTSDNEKVKHEAVDYFGADKVVTFEKTSFHFDMDFEQGGHYSKERRRTICESVQKILLDFHLLKECDMAVVSHSGFGLLGLWNRPDPGKDLYVFSNNDRIKLGKFARENLTFIKLDNMDEFYFGMG
jgi:hypothetical protein